MFRGFVTFRGLHLINPAHSVGFHRGDGLAKQDKTEAGGRSRRGDDWRCSGLFLYFVRVALNLYENDTPIHRLKKLISFCGGLAISPVLFIVYATDNG